MKAIIKMTDGEVKRLENAVDILEEYSKLWEGTGHGGMNTAGSAVNLINNILEEQKAGDKNE